MKKRILSVFLVMVLLAVSLPNFFINVSAASNIIINGVDIGYAHGGYFTKNGKSCSNSYWSNGRCHKNGVCTSATHSQCNCMRYWPTGSPSTCKVDLLASQCFGYARYCQYIVYGYHDGSSSSYFTNISGTISSSNCTASVLKSKLLNCPPATHVRTASSGKGYEHSISIISTNSSGVVFTDCNSNGYCIIRKVSYTWEELASYLKGYGGIAYANGWNRGGSTHTTHSYTGSYYEAAHPHKVYQQCSCGATKYTGEYKTVSSCTECSFTVDTKYDTVKGFKAYPCVSSNFVVYKSDLTTRNGEIYTTDLCTINEVYTNGWCKVTFPLDAGGTRTAYTKISNFIKSPSTSLTKYTASEYINLYSTSSLSTQVYKIYPNDVCYKIGTSGSATQIFMPHTGGYYVLGWVKTSDLTPKTYDNRFNPYCPIKAFPCATSNFVVYKSDYSTREGEIYTTDFCTINAVYSDGWCQVTFPLDSGGTRTGYTPLSNFVYNVNYTHVAYKAGSQIDVYTRKDLAEYLTWWVGAGDTFYVVGEYGSARQVFYPIAAEYGGGYKLGWIPSSSLPKTTYTVNYNANGGTGAPSAQTKTHGKDLTLSSTKPTRTGYTFVGWATSSSATTAQYSAGSVYSDNKAITLYAVWRKQTFTITYNANGGTNAPGVQTQTYGTAITVTNEKPEKTYTVTFNANGGTVNTGSYSLDCTFVSWNTKKDGTGTTVKSGSSYKPDANKTLYAIYTDPTLGNYIIPSRVGYTFNGWYTAASGGTRVEATSVITGNTTLYAQWSLETYSVVYFDDGSENIPAEQIKTYGTALTLSSDVPVKDGYTFKGWAIEEGSSTVVYTPGAQYTNDEWVILYPVWAENPVVLSSVSVKTLPTQTVYKVGEEFDSTGLTLELTYSNGTTEFVSSGFAVSGFDSSTSGTKTLVVTYADKIATFAVTIEEISADSPKYEITTATGTAGSTVEVYVSIANNPGIISLRNTISYDTSALELIAVQDLGLLNGYTTPSPTINSPYTLRWADSLATTNNTANGRFVKLTFKIKDNASSGNYEISVSSVEARTAEGTKVFFVSADSIVKVVRLNGMYVSKMPIKTTYNVGGALDTRGMVVTLMYADGTTETITSGFDVSGFDSSTVGTKTVVVSYGGFSTSFAVTVVEPVLCFEIKSVSYEVSGDKVLFTVTTTPSFNRVKVTKTDDLSSYIAYSSKYTVNSDGDYVFTLSVPAIEGTTQYAFDGRRTDTNKYSRDYYYTTVKVEQKEETPAIISSTHTISDGKIIFTVVTKSGNFNRIKVTAAEKLSGSLGVTNTYTVNAQGNYVWTIKATAPTETTNYAFDLRNSNTGKYLKEYFYYEVEAKNPTILDVTHAFSNGKIIFTVVTSAGDYNRLKVTLADNLKGYIAYANSSSVTVNSDGNYVWTIKADAPTETTSYAFDLRSSTTNSYIKDYYYYEVDAETATILSASHKISNGKIIFTVVTKAGSYDRIKATLANNLGGSIAVGTTYSVDADGNYVWTIKATAPTTATNYAFDLRVAGGKYQKEYFYYSV